MAKLTYTLILFSFCLSVFSQSTVKNDEKMNQFINELMGKMTIDEKIGQLELSVGRDFMTGQAQSSNIPEKLRSGNIGAIFNIRGVEKAYEAQRITMEESRMKIPLLFGRDVIHGYRTAFPVPLALACSWDMRAIELSARIAAIEASADGISWTFSPMVDISRDPRWGRIVEGGGEDPFLGGEIAKAMVRGYQGDNTFSDNTHILACVKHYALYGAPDGGRDYNTVDMGRIRMFNEYMYPYKAAIEAGAGTVMAAFNEIDGIPATANKWLMTDVLRNQWKFDGFVVTDYTGITEMSQHGIGDLQKVSARALKAGIDMDMVSEGFLSTLKKSLQEGNVSIDQINQACRRILEIKYRMGLFQDPYKYCNITRSKTDIHTPEHLKNSREVAAKTFVLLKNKNNTLPLQKEQKLAVIGPLANTGSNMVGTWSLSVDLTRQETLIEGLTEVVGKKENILYAKGSNLIDDPEIEKRSTIFGRSLDRDSRSNEELLKEALLVADKADVIVAALGESSEMNGESACRTNIEIPDVQKQLLKELVKTGKPVVLVLFTGRPLDLSWEEKHVTSILNVWYGGSKAALAIGDVLFGAVNPSGKLVNSFPQNIGQIPIYYNYKNTGRPIVNNPFEKYRTNYLDVSNEPLYPFGFGLSYTRFQYSDMQIDRTEIDENGHVNASITITNIGDRDGEEVVQMYIKDVEGSITRPVKELKGFDKVHLKAGESKKVLFKITPELLKFYNYDLEYVFEPGEFEVMIGANSRDVKTLKFNLKNNNK